MKPMTLLGGFLECRKYHQQRVVLLKSICDSFEQFVEWQTRPTPSSCHELHHCHVLEVTPKAPTHPALVPALSLNLPSRATTAKAVLLHRELTGTSPSLIRGQRSSHVQLNLVKPRHIDTLCFSVARFSENLPWIEAWTPSSPSVR